MTFCDSEVRFILCKKKVLALRAQLKTIGLSVGEQFSQATRHARR